MAVGVVNAIKHSCPWWWRTRATLCGAVLEGPVICTQRTRQTHAKHPHMFCRLATLPGFTLPADEARHPRLPLGAPARGVSKWGSCLSGGGSYTKVEGWIAYASASLLEIGALQPREPSCSVPLCIWQEREGHAPRPASEWPQDESGVSRAKQCGSTWYAIDKQLWGLQPCGAQV